VRVFYVAGARKPASIRPYQGLPRPGAVVGDQLATDGVLARRLGYAFIHYRPSLERIPLGPKLMNQLGRPLRPLLFVRRG
jgi:predicted HAD superfamily phosphohydrolase YqeG